MKGGAKIKRQQSTGLYRTHITVGTDPSGNPIYKYVSGNTKAELERARQEAVARYVYSDNTQSDMLFGEYMVSWFKLKRAPRLREITRQNYTVLINAHILPVFGNRQLRAIRSTDIQAWLNEYAGRSKSLADKLYMLIRAVCKSAYADGYMPRDPCAALQKPLPGRSRKKRVLNMDETAAVLNTIRTHPDGAYLAVLYYLGVRRGEALGLQWGDVDFDAGLVHIQRDIVYVRGRTTIGELKTEAADRYVILPGSLADILRPMRLDDSKWVFANEDGGPIGQTTYKRLWLRLMADAGLVAAKDGAKQTKDIINQYSPVITAHFLRHSYITKLFYAGVDPVLTMWMVGHELYETTVDVYTHINRTRFATVPTDMAWVYDVKARAQQFQAPGAMRESTNRAQHAIVLTEMPDTKSGDMKPMYRIEL